MESIGYFIVAMVSRETTRAKNAMVSRETSRKTVLNEYLCNTQAIKNPPRDGFFVELDSII